MADGLVQLEDHLVGREQHGTAVGRAVGRAQQFHGLGAEPRCRLEEPGLFQHLQTALPATAAPAEGARLRLGASVGRGAQYRDRTRDALPDVPARVGDVVRVRAGVPERRLPIHDPVVALEPGALGAQQVELVGQRQRVPRLGDGRFVIALRMRKRDPRKIDQTPTRGTPCPRRGAFSRLPQPGLGHVARARVPEAAAVDDRHHRAQVVVAADRLDDVLPNRQRLRMFVHDA